MLQTAINSNISGYCQYRLPCGYCERLGRDCPKQGYNYTPTITNAAERSINVCTTGAVDMANKVEG
jgi:hypothetical protein